MDFLFVQLSNLKKNYFLLLIVVLIIVLNDAIFLVCMNFFHSKSKTTVSSSVVEDLNKIDENNKSIYVDIKGEVKKPGVYKVDDEYIVNDVIKMAGGLKKNATTSNINLSKKVFDQMVIVVSTKSSLKSKDNKPVINNDAQVQLSDNTLTSNNEPNKSSSNLVNINTASLDELLNISGIGESKAKAIVSYREVNKFNSIDDIKNVSGIGDSLFEKIKDSITV